MKFNRFSFLVLLFVAFSVKSQTNHFVFIQTEDNQAFYVNAKGNIYSSTELGAVIIPKLEEGELIINIGFPQNKWSALKYSIKVENKDLAFLLKKSDSNEWQLYDYYTLAQIQSLDSAKAVSYPKHQDTFSNLLSLVSNVNLGAELYKEEKSEVAIKVATINPPVIGSFTNKEAEDLANTIKSAKKDSVTAIVKDTLLAFQQNPLKDSLLISSKKKELTDSSIQANVGHLDSLVAIKNSKDSIQITKSTITIIDSASKTGANHLDSALVKSETAAVMRSSDKSVVATDSLSNSIIMLTDTAVLVNNNLVVVKKIQDTLPAVSASSQIIAVTPESALIVATKNDSLNRMANRVLYADSIINQKEKADTAVIAINKIDTLKSLKEITSTGDSLNRVIFKNTDSAEYLVDKSDSIKNISKSFATIVNPLDSNVLAHQRIDNTKDFKNSMIKPDSSFTTNIKQENDLVAIANKSDTINNSDHLISNEVASNVSVQSNVDSLNKSKQPDTIKMINSIQDNETVISPAIKELNSTSTATDPENKANKELIFIENVAIKQSNGSIDSLLIENQKSVKLDSAADSLKDFADTSATNVNDSLLAGSNCIFQANEEDFMLLRGAMLKEPSDKKMIITASGAFNKKCYTTLQIKNLAVLFLSDEDRYLFLELAFRFVSDRDEFKSLQGLLTEEKSLERFKQLLKK